MFNFCKKNKYFYTTGLLWRKCLKMKRFDNIEPMIELWTNGGLVHWHISLGDLNHTDVVTTVKITRITKLKLNKHWLYFNPCGLVTPNSVKHLDQHCMKEWLIVCSEPMLIKSSQTVWRNFSKIWMKLYLKISFCSDFNKKRCTVKSLI